MKKKPMKNTKEKKTKIMTGRQEIMQAILNGGPLVSNECARSIIESIINPPEERQ